MGFLFVRMMSIFEYPFGPLELRYKEKQTGPKRWNQSVPMEKTKWKNIFKSVQKTCRENKVREFHFKFIHRIVLTKKEL